MLCFTIFVPFNKIMTTYKYVVSIVNFDLVSSIALNNIYTCIMHGIIRIEIHVIKILGAIIITI